MQYLRSPAPFPTLELELEPIGNIGTVTEPGTMLEVRSPFALGSQSIDENPDSLLNHGRFLVVSGTGASETLVELDPVTGSQTTFSDTTRVDAAGDAGLAQGHGAVSRR